ncbi:phage tail tape measure protein [Leuconostoc gasicomitatum]|uniref:phage tail tape measure protein n=1 Tax=Leuconostoc gasicomitatum TaxID=115778 RepID=UPI0015CB3326|nr:phage tail tape measure protein [Leuconostoc gasicomitatum]QLG77571.1 phage tail tape measure protein [Leuconostoc gasicomitatum]
MATYNGGEVVAHVGADISDYQSAMKSLSSSTSSAVSSASQAISSIGKTLAVTGAAITALGVKSVSNFGDFQASLNKAAVIAGGTSKDIQGLSDVANHMGAVLPISAQDAADAMVAMARDGATIGTIKKEFPAIAQAATAAGADLQSTASVVQQSMNIWGDSLKSPQRAAAILTQTANLSNASIEDMQQALATIGGTASNAGIDMNTTATAIGLLTNKGFSAAQASQDLNHALLLMQAPSDKAAKQAAALGLNFNDAQGNMKPLPTILNEISDSMDGMTSSEKAAALKTMFGTSGMAAILPLMKSVKDTTGSATTSWSAFTDQMDKASSSTATATKFLNEQANEMQQNLGSKLEQVGGNWEALRNAAMSGSSGVISSLVGMASSALEWATTSNSAVGTGIRTFLGLSPIIGAATLATGSFLTAATKIGSVMSTVGMALKGLFISPLGIAVLAIAALVGALVYAYKTSADFRNAVNQLGNTIKSAFGPAVKFATSSIKSFVDGSINLFKQFASSVTPIMTNMIKSINFNHIATTVKSVFSAITTVLSIAKNAVADFIKGFLNTGAITTAWNAVVAVIKAIITVSKVVINAVAGIISSFQGAGESASVFQMIGTLIGSIVTVVANVITAVANFIDKAMSIRGVSDVIQSVVVVVGSLYAGFKLFGLVQAVISGVTTAINVMRTALSVAKGAMIALNAAFAANPIGIIIIAITAVVAALVWFFSQTTVGKKVWSDFVTFMGGVWQGVISGVTAAGQWVSNVWNTAVAFIQGIWSGVVTFFAGIWNGIIATLQPLFTALTDGWNNAMTNLSAIWNGIVTIASAVWNLLKDVIMGPILLLLDLITGDFTQLGIDAANIWNNIVSSLGAIWSGVVQIATIIFNILMTAITNVWNMIASFTVSVWNAIVSKVVSIWKNFVSNAASFASGLFNGIKNIWNAIPGWASGLWNSVKGAVSGIWNGIVSFARSFASNVFNGIRNIWNSIPGWASGIWNSVRSVVSSAWNSIRSTIVSMANNAISGLRSAWGGIVGWVSGIWNGVKGAIRGAMNFSLFGAGSAIMNGFLSGLRSVWGAITSFVGGIASWIRAHKGPISYDRKLLIPAGAAIIGGFGNSLNTNFADVKKSVSSYAGQIADEFGQQKYVASAQLTASSTGVAGHINGGLDSLSKEVAEQSAQQPIYEVHNEIIGDKITTTVNSKNARRQAMSQFIPGGA